MDSLIGWLALVPLWWCHEAGRYLAARIAHAPVRVHWWGVHVTGSRGKRALVGGGGAIASYLACTVLALAFYMAHGIATTGHARVFVGEVRPGFDAVDKLAPGDVILNVDHEPLFADSQPGLVDRVNARTGQPITMTIDREGVERTVTIQPKSAPDATGRTKWLLGIRPEIMRPREHAAGTALGAALRYPFEQLRRAAAGVVTTTTGSEHADPGGPVRIVDEYQREDSSYSWLAAAMVLAAYALLLLLVVDAVRLVPRYAEST